jgi:hypothetical protein
MLAALAIAVAFVGAYVAVYFGLGDRIDQHHSGGGAPTGTMTILRTFPQQWQASLFWPAAAVESLLRGVEVRTTHDEAL